MTETMQVVGGVIVTSVVVTIIDRVVRRFARSAVIVYLGGMAAGTALAVLVVGRFPWPDGTGVRWLAFVWILILATFGMRVLGNQLRARWNGDGGSLIDRDQPTDSVKADDRRGARQT